MEEIVQSQALWKEKFITEHGALHHEGVTNWEVYYKLLSHNYSTELYYHNMGSKPKEIIPGAIVRSLYNIESEIDRKNYRSIRSVISVHGENFELRHIYHENIDGLSKFTEVTLDNVDQISLQ